MEKSHDLSLEQILSNLISSSDKIDVLSCLDHIYDSVNPTIFSYLNDQGKKFVKSLNQKNGSKECNVYFTMGNENFSRTLLLGSIMTMLWIEDYIFNKGQTYGVSDEDRKTVTKVFRQMNLPQIADVFLAIDEKTGERKEYSNLNYSQCMANFALWAKRGSLANGPNIKVKRSNREVCETLLASVLDSFVAVPYTAYYLGTVKTNSNPMELNEKISKNIKIKDYFPNEFMIANEPKFTVTTDNACLTPVVHHPLTVVSYGFFDTEGGKVNWGIQFLNHSSFDKLCIEHGLNADEIKKYMMTTPLSVFEEDLKKNVKEAKFIKDQKIAGGIYTQIQQSLGLRGSENMDQNYL